MEILRRVLSIQDHPEIWLRWMERAGKALIVLALAWLLTRLVRRLMQGLRVYQVNTVGRRGATTTPEIDRRAATLIAVLSKLAGFLIWTIAIVMALTEMTFNIQPLLAGLGVAGIALGLGTQSLVKDWLGGLFIVLEDQARIGDSVNINGIAGVVEELNLRTTVVRSENGALHMIPNGSITIVSNLSREYAYYVFETIISHSANAVVALDLVQQTGDELAQDPEFSDSILGAIEVMGLDKLGEKGSTIRARIRTVPGRQMLAGRAFNLRVRAAFDKAGIEFPRPV